LKIFVMCLLLSEAGFGGNFFERLDRRATVLRVDPVKMVVAPLTAI
jgi:hypothetical protein